MSVLDASRFMLAQQMSRFDVASETEINIRAGKRTFQADLYLNKGECKGTIVFIHGMSVHGNQDERIKTVGRAMATAGYRLVAPLIPAIKNLEIDPEQSEDVAGILRAIAGDGDLTRGGRLGVIAPSFSAAMTFKALTLPDLHPVVSSLMLIGGFADLTSTLEFLIANQVADEYGRLVVLWNFLHLHLGRRKRKLIDAFKVAAVDNGLRFEPGQGELPAYLQTLSSKDRALFQEIRENPTRRVEIWHKIMHKKSLQKKFQAMDVLQMVKDVRTPTTLLHGRHDDVIHADQSELLFEKMRQQGVPVHLCISGLISHGDTSSVLGMLPEAVDMARAFGNFFEQMKKFAKV